MSATQPHEKAGASRQQCILRTEPPVCRHAEQFGIIGERILRFGDTYRQSIVVPSDTLIQLSQGPFAKTDIRRPLT